MSRPTTSLIISTYNAPQRLRLCLNSVLRQTVAPSEVIIADDGSGADTRKLIDEMRPLFHVPLKHVWHEDKGFRLAAIRNKAIAEAVGDYVIQIDGDVILHRHFIKDHLHFAEKGFCVTGSRCGFSEKRTQEILLMDDINPSFFSRGITRRDSAFRLPAIAPLCFHHRHTLGCNMAFWKKDLMLVNGYDESFEGWGHEERDLVLRLQKAGIQRRKLKYCAIQYHLWHREQSRENLKRNEQIVKSRQSQTDYRVKNGIVKE